MERSRTLDFVNTVLTAIGLLSLALMVGTVCLQILTRWVLVSAFDVNFVWTESLARYFLVAMTFIGAGLAARDRDHIKINIFFDRMPHRVGYVVALLQQALVLGLLVVFLDGARRMFELSRFQPHFPLPAHAPFTKEWLYIWAIFGGLLMALYSVRDAIHVARTGNFDFLKKDIEDA